MVSEKTQPAAAPATSPASARSFTSPAPIQPRAFATRSGAAQTSAPSSASRRSGRPPSQSAQPQTIANEGTVTAFRISPRRRSVTTLTARAEISTSIAIRAGSGAAASSFKASAEAAAQLLRADEVLVAFADLAARDPVRLEPGAVRGAEVLDEPRLPLPRDGGVLAADLAGVDDQIAVLSAADQEPVLLHAVELAPFREQHQRNRRGGTPRDAAGVHAGRRGERRRRGDAPGHPRGELLGDLGEPIG